MALNRSSLSLNMSNILDVPGDIMLRQIICHLQTRHHILGEIASNKYL